MIACLGDTLAGLLTDEFVRGVVVGGSLAAIAYLIHLWRKGDI